MTIRALALIVAIAAAGCATSPEPSPWATSASRDLAFIREQLEANHPGAIDTEPQNAWFRRWLERGYSPALQRAQRAETYAGYFFAIQSYTVGFQDGHLSALRRDDQLPARWPGFFVVLRGGRWIVAASGHSSPSDGDELVDCDGHAPTALAETIIAPYTGQWSIASQRERLSPLLLVDEGNPFAAAPTRCRFAQAGEVNLDYHPLPREELRMRIASVRGDLRPSLELRSFGDGGQWISLSTFGGPNIRPFVESLTARAADLRSARILVFDMRGNGGGASTYGDRIVAAVWGEGYQRAIAPIAHAVDWRVSDATIEHFQTQILPTFRERFGENDPAYQAYLRLTDRLIAARGRDEPFVRQDESEFYPPARSKTAPMPVAARVFLLTDAACASACLDFADLVLRLPNVTHVGQETGADAIYIDNRSVRLPSGAGELSLSMKVYRDRPRGHNQTLVPSLHWDGSMADSLLLERWIIRLAGQ